MVQRVNRKKGARVVKDEKDNAQEAVALSAAMFPIGVYKHYKGGEYVLYSHSLNESDLTPLIHYYSLKKKTRWTRTEEDFMSLVPAPPGSRRRRGQSRFVRVRDATVAELLAAAGLKIVEGP